MMPREISARRNDQARAGFTLIELTVVVALIGLLFGAVSLSMNAINRTRLKTSAVRISAAIKGGYAWAAMNGRPARLAMDLDKGEFWLEESKDRLVLDLEDPSGAGGTAGQNDGGVGEENAAQEPVGVNLGEMGIGLDDFNLDMGAGGGAGEEGSSGFLFFDLSKDPFLAQLVPSMQVQMNEEEDARGYPPPRFRPLPGNRGEKHSMESGVRFGTVYTPHDATPRENGRAFLFFLPGGRSEEAIIQLKEGEERVISVKVHPLTGRTEIVGEAVEPEHKLGELSEDQP